MAYIKKADREQMNENTIMDNVENVESKTDVSVPNDFESLKKENDLLKEQLSKLTKMVEKLASSASSSNAKEAVVYNGSKMDRPCTVIHLVECPNDLPTVINLNGIDHYFLNFGERKTFRFAEMQNLTTKYRSWFERGVFTLAEDCDELVNDFGISIVQNRIPVDVYKKLGDLNSEDFKRLVESINSSQRVLLAKTWVQRYNAKKPGYENVDKIRILNRATNGLLKNFLRDIIDEEE